MLFRRARIIRVTTEQELESALQSADQVIVEGDDRLLSYAVARASNDPADHLVGANPPWPGKSPELLRGRLIRERLIEAAPMAQAASGGRRCPILVTMFCLLFLALLIIALAYYLPFESLPPVTQASRAPPPPSGPLLGPSPPPPLAPANNLPAIIQALAWPAVTIALIAALYFVARQAIAGGQNVEISWKVTEKVTGRVLITRVRTRAEKRG